MVNLKITAHGGVNEIGGNQILLEHESKLFLDFGISFSTQKNFYEFPLLVPGSLTDLINTNLIPNLLGLYRNAGIAPIYDKNNLFIDVSKKIEKEENYAGVLISHAHVDHYYFFTLLRDYIPIYLSSLSKRIIELKDETSYKNWRGDSSNINLNALDFSRDLILKEYTIKSFPVDHSLPGATAFLISINGMNIVYTGDMRFHGIRGETTRTFKNYLMNHDIDVLISEGTKLKPEKTKNNDPYTDSENILNSEQEVKEKFINIVNNEKNLVIYDASYYDFDRLKTIWKATIECGRTLILPSKQAYFVNKFMSEDYGKDFPDLKTVKILLNTNKGHINQREKDILRNQGLDNIYFESWKKYRKIWEKELINSILNSDQLIWKPALGKILDDPDKYVVFVVDGARFLKDLKKPTNNIIGTYIYGKAESFDIEGELKFNKLKQWVNLCKLNFEYAHSSGHLSEKELARFINDISPKILIPVHTEAPERFKKILGNPSINIKLLEKKKTYQFNL